MRSKLPSLLRLSTRTRAYEIFSNSADGDRDYFAGVVFSRSLEIVIKSRTNTADLIQNVGVPVRPWILDEIHELLRGLPRHCRILRPQISCLRRTAISALS